MASGASSATDPPAVLPTLCHLISFWEELSSTTLRVVEQNLIIPTPILTLKPAVEAEKDDKEKNTKGKSKKSKENKHAIPLARGNLFGEAAGGPLLGGAIGGGDKDTMCELCNLVFPHPVTYHMRQAHPGCGKPAGGQGYNSGGNFCGGWAGNCGDGGMGGSTWYLMCDTCRSKYLRDRIQVPKDRSKKTKKKSPLIKQSSYLQAMDPHLVMKNNAMFILDLASACSIHLPLQAPNSYSKAAVGGGSASQLPMLNEDMISDHCTFPLVPFSYLEQCGARAADSAFNEDAVFAGEIPRHGVKTRNFEHSVSQGNETVKDRVRPNSIYVLENSRLDDSDRAMLEESWNLQLPGRLSDDEERYPNRMQKAFQRSISELGSGVLTNTSLMQQPNGLPVDVGGQDGESLSGVAAANGRRRNNSSCMGYNSGMSLLKHPSAAMSRLIQTSDKTQNEKDGLSVDSLPVMKFCMQRHDLESLQCCMKLALCKASCRTYALQAFNWLVRQVTQLECLHDLFWHFVSSLSSSQMDEDEEEPVVVRKDKKEPDPEKGLVLCEHPLSDITIAGEAVAPLIQAFHAFLQTISDVMMYLPAGSALQQMAVRCWCLKFQLSDHVFLHRSHVFSNISKILSKSEEGWDPSSCSAGLQTMTRRKHLKDLTAAADVKASSRQAMIASVTDNSTETFWESGDEDKNKSKTITITCAADHRPKVVYVHIDNARDLGNKVNTVAFSAGSNAEDLAPIRQLDLELRFAGWVNAWLPEGNSKVIRLELKGPDNSLRVRQIKVLGDTGADGPGSPDEQKQQSAVAVQQKNCEMETLKVFRLLTSQVFGRLINEGSNAEADDQEKTVVAEGEQAHGDVNLKEHMVSILFSRSKLTQLQKLVCTHIVQAIRKETIRVQEQWEDELTESVAGQKEGSCQQSSDAYCFELLSLVLALSGSTVGRHYLAQQHSLLEDLLSLLHTASPRVQRQVVALIRRVLLDVQPKVLAGILGVFCLPPSDFSILSSNSDIQYDPNRKGLLDVFLACIAKALIVQVKSKLPCGGKSKNSVETFRLADCFAANNVLPGRWWFRGTISIQLAETIISLLKDLSAGKLTKEWAAVTKSAIAEPVLILSHLSDSLRNPTDCLKTPTLWLTMAALCVLSEDHVDQLSSGQWVGKGEASQARPTCENHDDGETLAMILCNECGNLCSDCDRILHLHRKARSHQRQVFKEEEEAIKVDLHEGCGRIKLYWLLALADSKTLKAVVEFRNASKDKLRGGNESVLGVGSLEPCRFCGTMTHPGLMTVGTVCNHPECQEHAKNACTKTLPCGHACGGIRDEDPCLFCLHGCSSAQDTLKQDADDMCMICFTEALSAAPAIQLACGHVFHWHCCRQVLQRLWPGPRITFGFSRCPICKADIAHSVLEDLLQPIRNRQEDVRRKAMMRLEYEGLHKADAIKTAGMSFHNDPAGYAMDRYAYYVCFKCKKAYYGGEARCEEQAAAPDDYDPSELVCGACSDVSRAQMCSRHGADFLEYKCRYCCSVAIFFCFGTTHFCNACHEDFQRVTTIPKSELPHCPAGPKAKQLEGDECPLHVVHPATGEEFALGCGICRNAHTF